MGGNCSHHQHCLRKERKQPQGEGSCLNWDAGAAGPGGSTYKSKVKQRFISDWSKQCLLC